MSFNPTSKNKIIKFEEKRYQRCIIYSSEWYDKNNKKPRRNGYNNESG